MHLARRAYCVVAACFWLALYGFAHAAEPPRYGFIISIENYLEPVPVVEFAQEDGDLMREVFEKNLHIKKVEAHSDLTNTRLRRVIDSLGAEIKEPDAQVFVYFVGHGSKEIDRSTTKERGYLLGTDSDPSQLSATAYPYDQLIRKLADLRARNFPRGHVYIFMESCFSGRSTAGPLQPNTMSAAAGAGVPLLEIEDAEAGLTTVAAATSDQVAYWDDDLEHGIFTFYLAAGLSGYADGSLDQQKDGQLMLDELGGFVREKVRDRAKAVHSAAQTPEVARASDDNGDRLIGIPSGDYVLANDLASQQLVDDALIRALMKDDPDKMSPDELRAKLEEIRRLQCLGCDDNEELGAYRKSVEARLTLCSAERRVFRAFASRGKFNDLSEATSACECCEQQVVLSARLCGLSQSIDSKACQCLKDDDCEMADEACASDLQAAKASVEEEMSLRPLSAFAEDTLHAHCPETAAIESTTQAVCASMAERLLRSGDVSALRRFEAGMAACEQVSGVRSRRIELELADAVSQEQKVCETAWQSVAASPDDDVLARFLSERTNCQQMENARQELKNRADTRWSEALSQEQEGDAAAAKQTLEQFLRRFGNHISPSAQKQFDEKIAILENYCRDAFDAATASKSRQALRRFVRENENCPQVANANGLLVELERCASDWDPVRPATRISEVYGFIDTHPTCDSEIREARDRLDNLFQSCMANGERAASLSYESGKDAYDQCLADFGRDPDRRAMVNLALARLTPPPAPEPPRAERRPPAESPREFQYFRNTDFDNSAYPADDLVLPGRRSDRDKRHPEWLRNKTMGQCENLCRTNSECSGFTFNRKYKVCILKRGINNRTYHSDATSAAYADE